MVLCYVTHLSAQSTYLHRYLENGSGEDASAFHFTELSDGSYLAASSCLASNGNHDFCFTKLDATGNVIQSLTAGADIQENYSASANLKTFDIAQNQDLLYAIEGHDASVATVLKPVLIRFSTNTNTTTFIKKIDRAQIFPTALSYTNDDGCVLAASPIDRTQLNISSTGVVRPSLLCKFDPAGNVLWQQAFNDANNSNPSPNGSLKIYDVCALSDGNVAITCVSDDMDPHLYLLKVNGQDGSILWQRKFEDANNTNANLVGYDLAEIQSGDLLICGNYIVSSNRKGLIIKTSANGEVIWTKLFGTDQAHESAYTVHPTPNGFILGGGTSIPTGATGMVGNSSAFLMKFNDNDGIEWFNTYQLNNLFGTGTSSKIYRVEPTLDGGYAASAGRYESITLAPGEMNILIKTDSKGEVGDEQKCVVQHFQLYPPTKPIKKYSIGSPILPGLNLGLHNIASIQEVPSTITASTSTVTIVDEQPNPPANKSFSPTSESCLNCNCQ